MKKTLIFVSNILSLEREKTQIKNAIAMPKVQWTQGLVAFAK